MQFVRNDTVDAWISCDRVVGAYTGCDDGTVHLFDFSGRAAAAMRWHSQEVGGGFSHEQKQALTFAVEAARRREATRVAR